MHTRQAFGPRVFVAACGAAALLSVTACGNNGATANNTAANRGDQPAAATTPAGDANARSAEQQRVNLTGCLQKGDGNSYILTEVNRPAAGSVTSGDNPNGSKVEKEQLQAAQHAYRLSADNNDDLDKLVGAQVRVEGMVAERSDLAANTAERSADKSVGTSGNNDRDNNGRTRDRQKIDEGNLAKVNVASIEKVSDGCGGRAAKASPKRSSKR